MTEELAVPNQTLDKIAQMVEKLLRAEYARAEREKQFALSVNDHEGRIRNMEQILLKLDGKIDTELAVLKGRNTMANIFQAAFTSAVGILAAVFGGGK
jgi:hypothetical protein